MPLGEPRLPRGTSSLARSLYSFNSPIAQVVNLLWFPLKKCKVFVLAKQKVQLYQKYTELNFGIGLAGCCRELTGERQMPSLTSRPRKRALFPKILSTPYSDSGYEQVMKIFSSFPFKNPIFKKSSFISLSLSLFPLFLLFHVDFYA